MYAVQLSVSLLTMRKAWDNPQSEIRNGLRAKPAPLLCVASKECCHMARIGNNRLTMVFDDIRSRDGGVLLPFITAGYPDLETTVELLKDFERRGVRVCELGVPFSDPVADGPTIQASYTDALNAGIDSDAIFQAVRRWRDDGGAMALLAMVSYSIVYRHGLEEYLHAAKNAGFDGFIIPDLSLEEAGKVESACRELDLANVMLVAPTTPPDRRLEIANHCSGFIYFISVAGITGERSRLPDATIAAVAELRKHTKTPVCVGFGISSPEMVRTVCKVADGAIVGSAIVHRITDNRRLPREELVKLVGEFVGELMTPLD